jgi:hypothetical protein
MKTPASVIAAGAFAIVAASIVSATADPKGYPRRSKMLLQDEQERYVYVTGSHLPQRVRLKSIGTTTPYNIRIYTREELQSTGRQTVAGALSLDPSIQISGH